MTKDKLLYYLDYLPLLILTISAVILIVTVIENQHPFAFKHVAGLILLLINYILFFRNHKLGVIALGATIIIGLAGLISFDHTITISSVTVGGNLRIPVFYGQPIFLLWFLIHFIISFRHYIGILTEKYWKDLFQNLQKR